MMQAIVLVLSVFYIILTLLADLLNAFLDPRIRVQLTWPMFPSARAGSTNGGRNSGAKSPGTLLRRRIFGNTGLIIGAISTC